jgi:hypothetical protein
MIANRWFLSRALGAALLLASCATAPKPAETSPRIADSGPEKRAAMRAAAPQSLLLEQNDERWQIDAARERKRQQDAAKARDQATEGGKSVNVTTPPPR